MKRGFGLKQASNLPVWKYEQIFFIENDAILHFHDDVFVMFLLNMCLDDM